MAPTGIITLGHTITLISEIAAGAGTTTQFATTEADNILISLYISSSTGDLDVTVSTLTEEGKETEIISFPTVTGPTTELLIRKSAVSMSRIKVVATRTGTATYEVRARGIGTGETSVQILGQNNWRTSAATVDSTAALLIPASLTDRAGMAIRNHDDSDDIYIAETLAKATTAAGFPVRAGETIQLDLTAGTEVYAVGTADGIDVRIIEAGS